MHDNAAVSVVWDVDSLGITLTGLQPCRHRLCGFNLIQTVCKLTMLSNTSNWQHASVGSARLPAPPFWQAQRDKSAQVPQQVLREGQRSRKSRCGSTWSQHHSSGRRSRENDSASDRYTALTTAWPGWQGLTGRVVAEEYQLSLDSV